MLKNRSKDLSELLREAERKGFSRNFAIQGEELCCSESGQRFARDAAAIVWSQTVDMGTDPGDDATLYLIETDDGTRGYVVVSDAFHADPHKAAFVDSLARRTDPSS